MCGKKANDGKDDFVTVKFPGVVFTFAVHEGRHMTVARFSCAQCPRKLDVNVNRANVSPLMPAAKARNMGWIVDPDKNARETRCPDCAKPKPIKKEKTVKVETEIKVTTEQRIAIRNILDKHFDDAAGMYLDDMSDEKVAQAVKIPRAVVERMRETAYGPIRVTAEVVAMRAEVAGFRTQLEALLAVASDLAAKVGRISQ